MSTEIMAERRSTMIRSGRFPIEVRRMIKEKAERAAAMMFNHDTTFSGKGRAFNWASMASGPRRAQSKKMRPWDFFWEGLSSSQ